MMVLSLKAPFEIIQLLSPPLGPISDECESDSSFSCFSVAHD